MGAVTGLTGLTGCVPRGITVKRQVLILLGTKVTNTGGRAYIEHQ